ncbi:hypothetical protein [Metabacillus sp. RGM 3146]|uniref:hypothetical protein n=1 Tax=Metabacillus sp. RGM 3146 TaxID=3401092 RepID=UPI003B9D5876
MNFQEDEVQLDEHGNYIVPPAKMKEVLDYVTQLNNKVDEMRVSMEEKISYLENGTDWQTISRKALMKRNYRK